MVPRENKNNAYAKFWGTNKEYHCIFQSGLFPVSLFFSSLYLMSQWGKTFHLLFPRSIDLKPTTVLRPYQVSLRLLVYDSYAKEILHIKVI